MAITPRHGLSCADVCSLEQDADAFRRVSFWRLSASRFANITLLNSYTAGPTGLDESPGVLARLHETTPKQLPTACAIRAGTLQVILDEEYSGCPASRAARGLRFGRKDRSRSGNGLAFRQHGFPDQTWAKKRLQLRLARRGIELAALLAAVDATARCAPALPTRLASCSWLSGVINLASGIGCASTPGRVSVLASRVMRASLLAKLNPIVGALVVLVVTAVATQQLIGGGQPSRTTGQTVQKETA